MSLKLSDPRADFSHQVALLYQERRELAILRGEQRRQAALAASPRLQAADLALKEAGSRQLHASFGGGEVLLDAKHKLEEARLNRLQVLEELGHDERFDLPDYHCSLCEDTGRFEGKTCRCYPDLAYPLLLSRSNMEAYRGQTFESFNAELFSSEPQVSEAGRQAPPRDLQIRLKSLMEDYSAEFRTDMAKSFFFHGRTGTGKTYLATCIGNALLKRGLRVYFVRFGELMHALQQYRSLQASFNPDPIRFEQAERFYLDLQEVDLLILDDLGSGIGDPGVHAAELMRLMEGRAAAKRPMLITANLDIKKILQLYDERVLSRLLGNMTAIQFYGPDVRTTRRP